MDFTEYAEQSQNASKTMPDAIATALRRAVIEGVLKDGAVLRQADLASKFGVSRVPIREALLKLQAEGLVEVQPRRGTVVVSLNADDFEEILEMRTVLESLALRMAVPKMTAADFQTATAILDDAEQSLDQPSSGMRDGKSEFESRWGDLNWVFHRALYLPARKPRLLDTIENLHLLFARHLRMRVEIIAPALLPSANTDSATRGTAEWAGVLKEHRDILAACEQHDARLACSILTHHITDHGMELVKRLRRAQNASRPK
jgi:DNA-binding GntR family transcriptional regulator